MLSVERFGETLWLPDINAAMESFPDSVSMQETACRCLSALLRERPSLYRFIGNDMGQLPICSYISLAMMKHNHLSTLFQSSCDVVLIMLSTEPVIMQEVFPVTICFHQQSTKLAM